MRDLEIIIALLILLGFSLLLGEMFEKYGFPEIVGNIFAGFILGPVILGFVTISPELNAIAELSLFFIILLIGIEVTSDIITKNIKKYIIFTFSGFVFPSIFITFILIVLHFTFSQSIITAMAISVPSISIISVLVLKYKILKKLDGSLIIASTVVSDIIAFSTLAILSNISNTIIILISLFIVLIILFILDFLIKKYSPTIRRFFGKMSNKDNGEKIVFGFIIILGMIFASVFQIIGITYILGAFFAGMLVYDTMMGKLFYKRVSNTFRRINYSFFIPIFFSIAGLSAIIPTGIYLIILLISIIIIVLFSILTYLFRKRIFTHINSKSGVGIIGGRGAVGISIGSIAFASGLITNNLYSVIIFGTIILSLTMPLMISKKYSVKHSNLKYKNKKR